MIMEFVSKTCENLLVRKKILFDNRILDPGKKSGENPEHQGIKSQFHATHSANMSILRLVRLIKCNVYQKINHKTLNISILQNL